jgi:hypothetical protein
MSATFVASHLASTELVARVEAALLEAAAAAVTANPANGTADQQVIRKFAIDQVSAQGVARSKDTSARVLRYLCATSATFKGTATASLSDAQIETAVAGFYTSAQAVRYITSDFAVGQ